MVAKEVKERVPDRYLALNPEDAKALGAAQGDPVELRVDGRMLELPVRLQAELARGVAVCPVALPGVGFLGLPGWGKIARSQA